MLELGRGTGRNLALIDRRYPGTRRCGLDISDEMLASARKTLTRSRTAIPPVLVRGDAGRLDAPADFGEPGFDRIVLSYTLSMIPPWRADLAGAAETEAEERGMTVRFTPLFGGYAWSLVISRASSAAPS